MRKKMTRFLSLLLVMSMVLSMGLSVGASAEDAEEDDLTVSFVTDGHATVDLYYSKDNYETADETNVTSAYVRGKGSIAIDNSGNGQVNFKVNVDEGYTYDISVSPESGYNNCKGEDETGVADIWRITKISADLTVTITTSATQTEIDDDTLWAYLDDGTDPAGDSTDSGYERTSWTSADYDDSAWKSSTGPFGAKNGAIASLGGGYDSYTLLTQYKEDGSTDIEAYFFRTTVTIEDASSVTAIVGQVIYDDAATVYINGTKVIGFDDDSITANLEYGGSNAGTPKTGDISLTDSTILSLLQDGENVIAVEIHQGRSSSSDIYFDMDLTFSSEEITAEQTDVNIAVGSDETERNITWYANVEGTGTLYLAKESDLVNGAMPDSAAVYSATGIASTTKDGYCYYQVSVTGLESGTTYAYQLVNGETAGEVYTFTTGADDGSFTFALVGDPQIGAGSTASDIEGWEDTLTYISENMTDAEFILSVGDQVNTANNETEYSGFLSTVLSSMTLATVIGNHDSSSVAYSEHFDITNASEYGSTAAGTDYYFVYENVLFLVLNSNNSSAAEHQAFMKQAIAEAEAEYDIDWKVVTFHHSVYSVASHATEDSILSLRNSLVPIFTELDIDVVLMGHDHVYCRTYMMDGLEVMDDASIYDDESYSSITDPSGILYVTVNSASGSKYYNIQENVDFEYAAVMNQDKERNVSQVTVTETSFTITTYAIENGTEVVDTFTINRTAGEESESYTVTAAEAENGTVTVSPASAAAGESVTVTAEPDEGYELASLTVTDAEGNEIAVTDGVFTMPASAVTVTAVFQESTSHAHTYEGAVEKTEPTCTEDGFYVITVACTECGDEAYTCTVTIPATGHAYGEGTVTVASTRYTTGVMSYTCTVCGETFTTKIAKTGASFLFDDVQDSGKYYYVPVYWAYDLGVTTGTSANLFSPSATCTRAQFVTFLYRLAQATGADTSVTITGCDFTDVSSGASYYQAMLWAVENEITNGTSSTTFSPSKTITRAQAVTMLNRYEKNVVNGGVAPTVSTTFTDYTDVVAGSFYEDAVFWAVENGITDGTGDTTFSPTQNCTRAMMVTFLYRFAVEPLSTT